MKCSIEGFNQEEALKFKTDGKRLDVIDLVILRWMVDFRPNMTTKVIDDEEYFWINYQYILEQLPMLNLGKRSLYDRLKKMCDFDILKHKNIKEKGNFSYYSFSKNYMLLVQKETSEDCESNFQTVGSELQNPSEGNFRTKINLSKDNYLPPISPPQEEMKHPKEVYEDIIGYMNDRVCEDVVFTNRIKHSFKSTNQKTRGLINARLSEGYSIDDIKDVIFYCYREWVDKPKKFQNGQMSTFYFRPSTMFSATNFETYLNDYKASL